MSECLKYLPLAIEITQNGGHHYHQVWRDEHAAVYEQKGALRTVIGYEAITIKKRPEEMKFGKLCPAREIYPCSEDWGTIAVTRRDLESAIEAAKGLSKRASARCRGKYVDDNTAGALAVSGQDVKRPRPLKFPLKYEKGIRLMRSGGIGNARERSSHEHA